MPSGTNMPLDAEPSPRGNIFIPSDGVRAAFLNGDDLAENNIPPDVARYLSHFATCPNAARHRRKGA
jgi:hypothetical protein